MFRATKVPMASVGATAGGALESALKQPKGPIPLVTIREGTLLGQHSRPHGKPCTCLVSLRKSHRPEQLVHINMGTPFAFFPRPKRSENARTDSLATMWVPPLSLATYVLQYCTPTAEMELGD